MHSASIPSLPNRVFLESFFALSRTQMRLLTIVGKLIREGSQPGDLFVSEEKLRLLLGDETFMMNDPNELAAALLSTCARLSTLDGRTRSFPYFSSVESGGRGMLRLAVTPGATPLLIEWSTWVDACLPDFALFALPSPRWAVHLHLLVAERSVQDRSREKSRASTFRIAAGDLRGRLHLPVATQEISLDDLDKVYVRPAVAAINARAADAGIAGWVAYALEPACAADPDGVRFTVQDVN